MASTHKQKTKKKKVIFAADILTYEIKDT